MTEQAKTLIQWCDKKLGLANAAVDGPWQYCSFGEGGRVVSYCYPPVGPFGSPKPPDRISRSLSEHRSKLCECHPENALHWVPAEHDNQERDDLLFVADARMTVPDAMTLLKITIGALDRIARCDGLHFPKEMAASALAVAVEKLNDDPSAEALLETDTEIRPCPVCAMTPHGYNQQSGFMYECSHRGNPFASEFLELRQRWHKTELEAREAWNNAVASLAAR